MRDYGGEYFDLLREKLEQMLVTSQDGETLSREQGYAIWAEKARNVQQDTKGLIFFCGNGASASMAEHMSHDWFQNAQVNTTTCSEISHITAISNDIGYEDVYSYRIKRILSDKDILVGISSSGNSRNIINAVQAAKDQGAFTITLTGMEKGNALRRMGHLNFYVSLAHYGEVESAHAVLLHSVLDFFLDEYMGGRH